MKITPIAILAVACLWSSVQAATLLVGYDNFTSLSNGVYSIAGSPTIEEGVMKVNPTASRQTNIVLDGGDLSSNGLNGKGQLGRLESIVTMTISNLTLPTSGTGILFELGVGNVITGQWGLGVQSDGKLTGLWGSSTNGGAFASGIIDWTQPVTITASTGEAGTKIYVNGDLIGTTGGLKGGWDATDNLYLGGRGDNTGSLKGCSYDLSSLYVHGGTMTDAEVKTFVESLPVSAPVPEPTTAAMGLIGLAALLIRRRRL